MKTNNEVVKGVLKTDGTRFVNGEGQEVILTGYGAANWQNVEGFMIGSAPLPKDNFKFILFPGPGKDHNPERWTSRRFVSQQIRELCGQKYLDSFWDRWEENYLAEGDFRLMAEMGYNCVRIVLNANALLYEEPGIQFNEGGFGRLARLLDWCEQYRLYAILDMHGVVGGNNGATGDSLFCEYPSVFLDAESKERQIILWEEIVRRFASRWIVAGYDLINEPVSSPVQHEHIPLLIEYYDECIERIRKIDREHIIFLEGAKFARDTRIFHRRYDERCNNWAISIHIYGASPEIKDLYPWLLLREKLNVPIWLGECGADRISDAVFYEICRHLSVSYTPWAWKTAYLLREGGHAYSPLSHHLPADWKKIQAYQLVGPRPAYAECIRIMDELIESTKIEHCVINRDIPRMHKKQPDIDIPGVCYDMWKEDGSRYYGNWELSNYLDFRLEDHTKLVWASEKTHPYPKFAWYDDPGELKYDPKEDLALELSEGENAYFSVYQVERACWVAFAGVGECELKVFCCGELIGEVSLRKGDILKPQLSDRLSFGPGEKRTIRVSVQKGTLTLKTVKFAY